jgi:hypothetical protein
LSTLIDHPPNKSGVVSIIMQYILHSGEYAFALWDLVQFKSPKGQGQGSSLSMKTFYFGIACMQEYRMSIPVSILNRQIPFEEDFN